MIRFAKNGDIDSIISLWKQAFGYDDFAKWYFDEIFDLNNTLVYELDGKVVSMLQRLPYNIKDVGKATYIYGACTDTEHRGKGIMSKLLTYSEALDVSLSKDAIFLVPENEGLFKFYMSKGYNMLFYKYLFDEEEISFLTKDELLVDGNIAVEINQDTDEGKFEKYAEQMLELYNQVNKESNYLVRDIDMFNLQFHMHMNSGGKVYTFFINDKMIGYTFGYVEENIYQISELVGCDKYAIRDIFSVLNSKFCRINVLNYLIGNVKVPYGCIKLLRKNLNINKIVINLVYD